MQRILPVLLLLALPLAGCVTPPSDEIAAQADAAAAEPALPMAPEAIDVSETVIGSLDPLNFVSMGICNTPTAQCFHYPFTAEGKVKLDATLTWGIPASDFDLYLIDAEGAAVTQSGATPPGASEAFADTVGAGDYEIIVVAWAVAQDTFALKVEFEAVGAPDEPAADAS